VQVGIVGPFSIFDDMQHTVTMEMEVGIVTADSNGYIIPVTD
jgi:hypothetical protein